MARARTVRIAPSLLAADFGNLESELRRAEKAGADLLHLDVMDGHYVPNITFGPVVLEGIRKRTRLYFDVHLMIAEPWNYIEAFAKAGADGLTIHLETCPKPAAILDRIGRLGKTRGLVINPDTPVRKVAPHLGRVDRLLIMSVFPGFGGQKFIEATYARLREARKLIGSRRIELQVDGGVYAENAPAVIEAGADCLVVGTGTFRARNMTAAVRALRGEKKATSNKQ